MGEPSDERVEAIRANQERLLRDGAGTPVEGWYQQTGMYQDVRTLLAAYDEQRARAERAERDNKHLREAVRAAEGIVNFYTDYWDETRIIYTIDGKEWIPYERHKVILDRLYHGVGRFRKLAALTAPADKKGNDDD